MATSKSKPNKNIKALFSVICLCIISLGLIVYFSTTSGEKKDTVGEPTTIVEKTTDVQRAVSVTQKTTKPTTSENVKKTTKKTTTPRTMDEGENNIPYKSYYKYPLSEAVLKGYSEELVYDETMGDYRAHGAVDFSGKKGDEVVAINDGLVIDVRKDNLLGMVVTIDHGATFVVEYCGLESVCVKKGSFVNIGNKIGTLGEVPVEGKMKPHLHLQATLDSKIVNPLDVMGKTE